MNNLPRVAVRALIIREKKLLLLQRSVASICGGNWCLPGGKVEFGQSLEQAVMTEVAEETSLNPLHVTQLAFAETLPTKNLNTHYITFYFAVEGMGTVRINHESADYCWVEQGDLGQYSIVFSDITLIKEFLA